MGDHEPANRDSGHSTPDHTSIWSAKARGGCMESLTHPRALLEQVVADASDAIVSVDESRRIVLFNKAAEAIFGFAEHEAMGRPLDVLLPTSLRARHNAWMNEFRSGRVDRRAMTERGRLNGRRKDGTEFPTEVTISRTKVADQTVLTAIVRDVSERQTLEHRYARDTARYRALFEHAADAILVVDDDNVIQTATPSYVNLLGFEPEDPAGRDGFALVHPDDVDQYRQLFAYVAGAARRSARTEFRARHRDGAYRWLEATVTNLHEEPALGALVVNARDITERKEAELALSHQAFHDDLTGLPNRALLEDRLNQALSRADRLHTGIGILFVDLDRFKDVFDTMGHAVGDHVVVVVVAERLRAALRPEDTIARVGGDEFVVVLPDAGTPTGAAEVANRLIYTLTDPVTINGSDIALSASVGSTIAHPGDDLHHVLASADLAMYQAKGTRNHKHATHTGTRHAPRRPADSLLDGHERLSVDPHMTNPRATPAVT